MSSCPLCDVPFDWEAEEFELAAHLAIEHPFETDSLQINRCGLTYSVIDLARNMMLDWGAYFPDPIGENHGSSIAAL